MSWSFGMTLCFFLSQTREKKPGKMQFSFEKLWHYKKLQLNSARRRFWNKILKRNIIQILEIFSLPTSKVHRWESWRSYKLLSRFVLKASELKGWHYFLSRDEKTAGDGVSHDLDLPPHFLSLRLQLTLRELGDGFLLNLSVSAVWCILIML